MSEFENLFGPNGNTQKANNDEFDSLFGNDSDLGDLGIRSDDEEDEFKGIDDAMGDFTDQDTDEHDEGDTPEGQEDDGFGDIDGFSDFDGIGDSRDTDSDNNADKAGTPDKINDVNDFDMSLDNLFNTDEQNQINGHIGIEINGKHIPPIGWEPKTEDIGKELIEYIDNNAENMEAEELTAFMAYLKNVYDIDYEQIIADRMEEQKNNSDEQSQSKTLEDNDGLKLEDMDSVPMDDIGADHDGTILESDSLLTDEFDIVNKDKDFISDNGEIVLMDTNDPGDGFVIQYIDIENIAVVKRIRKKNTNVEDLVQSIKSTGLLEPLVVTPTKTEGMYALLAGFRRLVACAKAGKRKVPCVVNTKANVPEIPILEALYNHSKSYTIKEIVDYIDYLEKEKGIMSASMIEYLLQLNSGDYTKLKDILNDNDDDIVSKLFDGIYTIEMAFKKLEQRRKKESAEEKENKKAAKVYEDEEGSGADNIAGSGEETSADEALTDEEIQSLSFSASDLDSESGEDSSLDEMVEDGKHMDGFEPNKQDYKDRERLDPTLRRAVLARDNNTCKCCLMSGQEYTEIFDVHHIVEVYLGGSDDIENLVTLCTCCHKLVHLYARGELQIRPESELSEEEQNKFKKIVRLGKVIRKGMQMKGMKKDELKKVDKADTIGRTKPGTGQIAG